ncbi:MAG: hypothetical protein MZV63_37340 [Marinilabiliales bacterium]|nr:hypothetical protein [Marinilabiliales bacterium]
MHDVIEIAYPWVYDMQFGESDLVNASLPPVFVQVEEMTHNWNYYLGSTSGLAQVSVSGKALNIDLFNDGSFTVSLEHSVTCCTEKNVRLVIVKIPEQTLQSLQDREKYPTDQKQISATV